MCQSGWHRGLNLFTRPGNILYISGAFCFIKLKNYSGGRYHVQNTNV